MPTRIASVSGLRGIVGDGLDPIGVVEFAAAYASSCADGAIVVGHDGRISAPVFLDAVLSAVRATGRDVLLAGPVATPTLGRLVSKLGAAGGIQISASHNPPTYNGLKFFQAAGMVLSPQSGREVLARIDRREFGWVGYDRLGRIRPIPDPDSEHLEAVLSCVDVEAIRACRFTVLLDGCHGGGGRMGDALLRALGCKALVLGPVPDGLYDHTPEPTETNLRDFARMVPASGAVVGFAQDPDADRLALIDETGRYIGEECTLALAATHRLSQVKGPVVLNLSTSSMTEVLARRLGCEVHRTPVGEIHVVEKMLAEKAVLGGEGNGGVIDPRVGFVRDSFVGMASVLDLLAKRDVPLSTIVAELPKFAMVKDQFPRGEGDASALFDQIAAGRPDARADRRDGLRLDWADRWAHVRSSNTEPIVRVIAEAPDASAARALADEIGRWVTTGGRPK